MNFKKIEQIIKAKGTLHVSHDPGGSGMEYYWTASCCDWPFCSADTFEGALKDLIHTHEQLEKEACKKRINEIDASANL